MLILCRSSCLNRKLFHYSFIHSFIKKFDVCFTQVFFFLLSCIGFTVIFSLYDRNKTLKFMDTHTHTFLAQKLKEVKSEKRDSQQICIWFTFHTPRLVIFLLCLECVVVTLHIGNLDHLVFSNIIAASSSALSLRWATRWSSSAKASFWGGFAFTVVWRWRWRWPQIFAVCG